jgi:hypothetical protein
MGSTSEAQEQQQQKEHEMLHALKHEFMYDVWHDRRYKDDNGDEYRRRIWIWEHARHMVVSHPTPTTPAMVGFLTEALAPLYEECKEMEEFYEAAAQQKIVEVEYMCSLLQTKVNNANISEAQAWNLYTENYMKLHPKTPREKITSRGRIMVTQMQLLARGYSVSKEALAVIAEQWDSPWLHRDQDTHYQAFNPCRERMLKGGKCMCRTKRGMSGITPRAVTARRQPAYGLSSPIIL